MEAEKTLRHMYGLNWRYWYIFLRYKSFALNIHYLLYERVHIFIRRVKHVLLIMISFFHTWANHDRVFSGRIEDVRPSWHVVYLKLRGLSYCTGIHSRATGPQVGVFLLNEHIGEAIIATHRITIHSWRGDDTWHKFRHLVSTECSELLLSCRS